MKYDPIMCMMVDDSVKKKIQIHCMKLLLMERVSTLVYLK